MRRTRAIAGSNIIVQIIHVTWEKSGRGGRNAERRNQIPLAFPLPATLGPGIGRHVLTHTSYWSQANDFASEITARTDAVQGGSGFEYQCATVRSLDWGVELEWSWNGQGGAPPRQFWDSTGNPVPVRHIALAQENEWVRARWNGRFVDLDTGNWSYEMVTINVGIHPNAELPLDFFFSRKLVDDYSQLADLW